MQSAVDHVLRVLDRTHDPRRVPGRWSAWARAAGFEQVSLDLIYGTPGESLADWERSLDAALACEPDHVSAYSLIVEEGTALARRVRRGELPMPDEDDLADKYLLADERLDGRRAGLVRGLQLGRRRGGPVPAQPPLLDRRRLVGRRPGRALPRRRRAVVERQAPGGVRRADRRRPSPAHAREVLDAETRRVERVLLELRLRAGLPLDVLDDGGPGRGRRLVEATGWSSVEGDRLVLTRRAGCWPTRWSATCCPDLGPTDPEPSPRNRHPAAVERPRLSAMTKGPETHRPGQPDPTQPYGQPTAAALPPPADAGLRRLPPPGARSAPTASARTAPYGMHPVTGIPYSDKSKLVAGLLQILLPFGIGRFYIGDTKIGVIQLVVTLHLRHRQPVGVHRRHHHAGDRQQGRQRLHAQELPCSSELVTKSMSSSTRPSRAGSRSS